MAHLIDKDVLVAQASIEITSCRLAAQEGILTEFGKGKLEGLEGIVDFLNTLEVKEVDFERELSKYVSQGIHRFFPNEGNDYYNIDSVEWQDYVIDTAKHFFDLGLKAKDKGKRL